jgi:hypothetical protein
MAIEQFTKQLGIGSIVFGAAGIKGFSKARQLAGIDRIEFQELIAHQMIDQRPATLLQGYQDFTFSSEALLQRAQPVHQSAGLMSNLRMLNFGRLGR